MTANCNECKNVLLINKKIQNKKKLKHKKKYCILFNCLAQFDIKVVTSDGVFFVFESSDKLRPVEMKQTCN